MLPKTSAMTHKTFVFATFLIPIHLVVFLFFIHLLVFVCLLFVIERRSKCVMWVHKKYKMSVFWFRVIEKLMIKMNWWLAMVCKKCVMMNENRWIYCIFIFCEFFFFFFLFLVELKIPTHIFMLCKANEHFIVVTKKQTSHHGIVLQHKILLFS